MQKLLKITILMSVFLISNVFAEKIENISISGIENVSRGTVLSYLSQEVGDEIIQETLNNAYQRMMSSNLFSDVEISFSGGQLKIIVKENPVIRFFEINGYEDGNILSEETITDISKNSNLYPGQIFIKQNLEKLSKELSQLYKTNGFFNNKIDVNTSIDNKNTIGIEIIVTENDRSLIRSFSIEGNSFYTEEELLDLFEVGTPDFFLINFFTEKDHFSNLKLDNGMEALRTKYLNSGFLDFNFITKDISYSETEEGLKITLKINEGVQYLINSIDISSDHDNATKKFLRSKIRLTKDEYLDRKVLLSGVKEIVEYFQNKGYPYTNVKSQIVKSNESDNKLDIDILVDEKYKAYINRIEISGNTTTQDDVIRRQLKLNEGQIYSKKDIADSISRIKRLGYFSNVEYKTRPLSNDSNKLDLLIEVIETKTGEISIGLSHSNSTGAALNAGISQKNIFGTGNTFNGAFSNSSAVEETSFYFKDPSINKFNHSMSYGYFDKQVDAVNLDAANYSISESGFIFGYGIPTSEFSNVFAETRISTIDLKCGDDLKNTYESKECNSNDEIDSKISFSYESNTLNDFYFPTKGSKNSSKFTLALPISDYQYFTLESLYRYYQPILNDKTLKLSSRLNYGSGYGGDELPFFKRFFEGGSSSVRGFDFNSLGSKYGNNKPKGGEFSIVSSAAISSNLDFIGIENPNMRGIVFTDLGTIVDKARDFDFNEVRSSVGIQFSWLTPIGPLGFNLAQPIIKKTGDSTETFSFELGAKF